MTASNNVRLFHCYLALCDNRIIYIRTFICILSPHPVKKNMQGIPILSTDQPIVVLKAPRELVQIPMQQIEGNNFQAGILHGCQDRTD